MRGRIPISTTKFTGFANKAARERSFCMERPRTIQSPRNAKPIVTKSPVQEELRVPCAILFNHCFWLGLSCPRLLDLRSSSVNSNMVIGLYICRLHTETWRRSHPSCAQQIARQDPTFVAPAREISYLQSE